MKLDLALIINPQAGGGRSGPLSEKVLLALAEQTEISYTAYYTQYPRHSEEIARKLYEEKLQAWDPANPPEVFPLIVVLGGDGTLHEVVNTLYPLNPKLPFGYLPCGSGNDFARGIGLSRDPLVALQRLMACEKPQAINMLHYTDPHQHVTGYAFNNLGIGLEAQIVHATNISAAKKSLNHLKAGAFSYLHSVLKVIFKQKGFPLTLEIDGDPHHFDNAFLCTTTNHPYFGGGIAVAPYASPFEENFDVVLIQRLPLVKIFYIAFLLLQQKHFKSPHVWHFQGQTIQLSAGTPQMIQTDGETQPAANYNFTIKPAQALFWL